MSFVWMLIGFLVLVSFGLAYFSGGDVVEEHVLCDVQYEDSCELHRCYADAFSTGTEEYNDNMRTYYVCLDGEGE